VALLIGAVLALLVGLSATFIGLDRDRAFYPTVMAVIATYYGLFAVMGGSPQAFAMACRRGARSTWRVRFPPWPFDRKSRCARMVAAVLPCV